MPISVTAPITIPAPIEVTAPVTIPNPIEVTAPLTIGFQGPQGPQGPQGGVGEQGIQGIDYDPNTDWMGLARGARTISNPLSTSLPGEVLQYDYDGTATRYRYISTDETIDAFYDSYAPPATLGALIASKFLNF